MKLMDYIETKENEFNESKKKINELKKISIPLEVRSKGSLLSFSSRDYSLIENFKLKKDNKRGGGENNYDGGYSNNVETHYIQPYFYLDFSGESKKVKIEDEDMPYFLKIQRTIGDGDYRDKTNSKILEKKFDEVVDYFKERGTPDKIVLEIDKRLEDICSVMDIFR